jgi:hypothetical protein
MVLLAGCAGVTPGTDQSPDGDAAKPSPDTNATDSEDTKPVDTDGDGLTDAVEIKRYGTKPEKADTDGDGLNDSTEVERGTDPTAVDTDGDGVNDAKEIALGTDPTTPDTDSDGLNDSEEIEHGTDPTVMDTDGDSLPDGFEVKMGGVYADADPLHKDVFVQVDYVATLDTQKEATIKEEFASAPLSNPDGTEGIDLHINYSSKLTCEPGPSANTDGIGSRIEYPCETPAGNTLSKSLPGHYYVRIVEEVDSENKQVDEIAGAVLNGQTAFVSNTDPHTASVFMHELGHLPHLNHPQDPDAHRSFSAYPSVMTYESPDGTLQYAKEDWQLIEQSIQITPGDYTNQADLVSEVR